MGKGKDKGMGKVKGKGNGKGKGREWEREATGDNGRQRETMGEPKSAFPCRKLGSG